MTLLPTLLLTLLPIAFATCPGKDSLSDSRVKQVLDLQNAWREQAAAGTLFTGKRQLPAGRNIYKLEWDCDLEELAKDAVKGCPETRTEIPRKGQAFLHLNSTVGKKRNQALNYSMTAWFDEAVFEVKGKDVVRSGNDKSLDFSNMINSDSYKVGCAEKRCGKGRNSTAAAACFYNKANVKMGGLVYRAGKNCTVGGKCTEYKQSTCERESGLCMKESGTTTSEVTSTTTSTTSTTTTPSTTTSTTTTTTTTSTTTTTPTTTTTTTTTTPTTTTPTTTTTTTPTTTTTSRTTTAAPVQPELMPVTSGENKRCSQNQGMTDVIRRRLIEMHNIRRSGLAAGNVDTTNNQKMIRSSNMMRLRWNCELEAAALQHAMSCTFAKSDESTRPVDGENQATIPRASTYQEAAEKAVPSWWKTVRTIGGVRDRIFKQGFVGTPIEGFTQMAWANTRKFGCAVVKCDGRYNVVCRYNPKGNIVGEEIYMRGPKCTRCPPGTRCVENLCTPLN